MTMRRPWLRWFGGRIALVALCLQLALSLGHLHPDDIFLYGRFVADGHGATQLVAPHPADPLAPIPINPGLTTDIDCPICASMAMVATAVPPETPHLLPLLCLGQAPEVEDARFVLTGRRFLAFQTRAPPLV